MPAIEREALAEIHETLHIYNCCADDRWQAASHSVVFAARKRAALARGLLGAPRQRMISCSDRFALLLQNCLTDTGPGFLFSQGFLSFKEACS